jgi:hypothetical protein
MRCALLTFAAAALAAPLLAQSAPFEAARGAALTPGQWSYVRTVDGSEARFGTSFTIRCLRASRLVVLRRIDAVQAAAGGLPSRLAEGDERRVQFDALHVLSTRLMMFNIAGALVLLYWEARE